MCEIQRVVGFNKNIRGGLVFSGKSTLFYISGQTGIYHSLKNNVQNFLPIIEKNKFTAMALSEKNLLAIASKGLEPKLAVYNLKSIDALVLPNSDLNSITEYVCLAFSDDEEYVAAQGNIPGWPFLRWHLGKNRLLGVYIPFRLEIGAKVLKFSFNPRDSNTVVAVGRSFFRMYHFKNETRFKEDAWHQFERSQKTFHSLTWLQKTEKFAVGTSDGTVLIFEKKQLVQQIDLDEKLKEVPSLHSIRLAYNTHEPVTGNDDTLAPVIFLHGATAFKESWGEIPQVVANATTRKSYSLDARNHGDSDWSDDFTFDVNVDDLLHFMDKLQIKKAILVGHSMGGITAIKTALKNPDRVESIIVEDMVVRKLTADVLDVVCDYISLMRQAIEKAPPQTNEDAVKNFIAQYVKANLPPSQAMLSRKNEDLEDTTRFIALRRGPDGNYTSKCNLPILEKAMRNSETVSSQPEGKYEGPSLFIYGTLSPFLVGCDEHHIKQFFPNAVLTGIDEADHSVHFRKPLEFTDALLKFIS